MKACPCYDPYTQSLRIHIGYFNLTYSLFYNPMISDDLWPWHHVTLLTYEGAPYLPPHKPSLVTNWTITLVQKLLSNYFYSSGPHVLFLPCMPLCTLSDSFVDHSQFVWPTGPRLQWCSLSCPIVWSTNLPFPLSLMHWLVTIHLPLATTNSD